MRRRRRDKNYYKALSVALSLIILSLAIYVFWPKEVGQMLGEVFLPELSTAGHLKVEKISTEIIGNIGYISLITGCYDLTATVEPLQAISIQRGLEKTYAPRPNAHDIAADVFEDLKIEVLMVKISELKENAFYAKLILRQGNTVLNLDARPSDAIAIALRTNPTIYINQTLLEEVGEKIC